MCASFIYRLTVKNLQTEVSEVNMCTSFIYTLTLETLQTEVSEVNTLVMEADFICLQIYTGELTD